MASKQEKVGTVKMSAFDLKNTKPDFMSYADFQNNPELIKDLEKQDRFLNVLEKYYNNTKPKDDKSFQSFLWDNIENKVNLNEKLNKKLNQDEIDDIKSSTMENHDDSTSKYQQEAKENEMEKEQIQNLQKSGIAVDKNIEKEAKEKLEEKSNDKDNNQKQVEESKDLKKVFLEAMYTNTLEEYYHLKKDLMVGFNGQVKTGELSPGRKMNTKLIAYEKYLKKINTMYKAYSGMDIFKDSEEVNKKLSELTGYDEKNEKALNLKTEKNIGKVSQLSQEIDSISEEIVDLSERSDSMDTEEFKNRMDSLQSKLVNKQLEMDDLDPSMERLIAGNNEQERYEDMQQREIGSVYMKRQQRAIDSKDKVSVRANDLRNERIDDKLNKVQKDPLENQKEVVKRLMDEAEEYRKDGNYIKAMEVMESIEKITTSPNVVETQNINQKAYEPNTLTSNDKQKVSEMKKEIVDDYHEQKSQNEKVNESQNYKTSMTESIVKGAATGMAIGTMANLGNKFGNSLKSQVYSEEEAIKNTAERTEREAKERVNVIDKNLEQNNNLWTR